MLAILLLTLQVDTAVVRRIPVAPAETLATVSVGSGTPVVLIPGVLGGAFGFRHLIPLLAGAGHRVIVIEPLGFGASSRPAKADYSLSAQAHRLIAVMEILGAKDAVVIAHAVGAGMVFRLLIRRPDLASGFLSIEGGPIETAATSGVRKVVQVAPWLKLLGARKLLRSSIRRGLIRNSGSPGWVTDAVVDGYMAEFEPNFQGMMLVFRGMLAAREPEPLAPSLSRIHCPVVVIVGTAPHSGGISNDQIALLRRSIAGFVLDSVPGAGLYIYEEAPGAVAAATARLLMEAKGRRTARLSVP